MISLKQAVADMMRAKQAGAAYLRKSDEAGPFTISRVL